MNSSNQEITMIARNPMLWTRNTVEIGACFCTLNLPAYRVPIKKRVETPRPCGAKRPVLLGIEPIAGCKSAESKEDTRDEVESEPCFQPENCPQTGRFGSAQGEKGTDRLGSRLSAATSSRERLRGFCVRARSGSEYRGRRSCQGSGPLRG